MKIQLTRDPVLLAIEQLNASNALLASTARTAKLTDAGNNLARVMTDILGAGEVRCAISLAVMKATLDKWEDAK